MKNCLVLIGGLAMQSIPHMLTIFIILLIWFCDSNWLTHSHLCLALCWWHHKQTKCTFCSLMILIHKTPVFHQSHLRKQPPHLILLKKRKKKKECIQKSSYCQAVDHHGLAAFITYALCVCTPHACLNVHQIVRFDHSKLLEGAACQLPG